MDISTKGLIEIVSREGISLSPYLDSVGVWTIGIGITEHDGVVPRTMGTITIDQAIAMFKERIRAYVAPVQKLGLQLTQQQFDALVSFCYNVGEGNLRALCRNRTIDQIGDAFDLYHKPPEITARRNREKKLFKEGVYSSDGKVLVFPVNPVTHKPEYHKGYTLDVRPHFQDTVPTPHPLAPPAPAPAPDPAPAKPKSVDPAEDHKLNWITFIIELLLGLFR